MMDTDMSVRCAYLLLAMVFCASPASAHQMPKTAVFLDIRQGDVGAELRLPLDRLEVPLHHRLESMRLNLEAGAGSAQDRSLVSDYVLSHVHAATPDGHPWSVDLSGVAAFPRNTPKPGGARDVVVRLDLRPPPGSPVDRFVLSYDVITRELVTHSGLVSVRSDWKSGVVPGRPELVGAVSHAQTVLAVDRSAGSAWRGLRSIFHLGTRHIAEGADHLLFLLTLLLPAPLVAVGGRWSDRGGDLRRGVLRIVGIVSAFTVGHSLTLLIGSTGLVRVPGGPGEVLIAVSLLVSAVHAIRPIFPGREPVIATCFGLIHGMAFATVIGELGLDGWAVALGIAAFNSGIEAMQLAVVAVAMPLLALLATTRFYRPVRVSGAVFAAVAAVAWIGERALGLPNPVEPVVDALSAHAVGAACLLAGLGASAALAERWKGGLRAALAGAAGLRGDGDAAGTFRKQLSPGKSKRWA